MTRPMPFVSVVLLVAALAAAALFVLPHGATPTISISLPAAQIAAPAAELDGPMFSTKHQSSLKVIRAFQAMPQIKFTGGEFQEGSIQIWAGIVPFKPDYASVAFVWANGNNVWYGALQGPVLSVASSTTIELASGKFLETKTLGWAGSWIMSSNSKGAARLVDDPAQYFDLGTGYSKWLETKARWGLNVPVAVFPLPLPPPPPGTPGLQ